MPLPLQSRRVSFVAAVITAVVAITTAVTGAIVVRRMIPGDVLRGHHDVAAAIIGVMGTLYAVLLAFTVIVTWNHYTDAHSATDAEAGHLGDLARLTEQERVRKLIDDYRRAVVDDEWPAMRHGKTSPAAQSALATLWNECRAARPANAREETIYAESMRQMVAISDSRRARIHSLRDDVPPLMWIILIGGGAMVITFTYLFGPERIAMHALMVGALATLIVMSLFLVHALDNPFDGWPHIEPDTMQVGSGI
jgi:hypothetical protein